MYEEVRHLVAERFQARAVALTDSGTSALVLAFRMALPGNAPGTVALPAYACPDLLSAAVAARDPVAQRGGMAVELN